MVIESLYVVDNHGSTRERVGPTRVSALSFLNPPI